MDADLPFSGAFPLPAFGFRVLDAQAPFGLWVCDDRGAVRPLDPGLLELAGIGVEPCAAPGWTARLDGEEVDAAAEAWRRCLASGEPWEHEFVLRGTDGSMRHVLSRGTPARDRQGRVRAWVGLNMDVTGIRAAGDEARRARERVLLALSSGGDYLYERDLATGRRRWFGPVEELLGCAREAVPLADADWDALVHGADLPLLRDARRELVTGTGRYRAEYRLRRPDGTVLRLLDRGRRVEGPSGRPGFLVGILTDLTASRPAAEAARGDGERRRAGQRLEVIGRLAGGIAHDFNNLLTAINGFSELLADTLEDASQKAYAQEIRRAGERAAQITRQLLAFSRRQMCAPRVLDLNRVAAEAARALPGILGGGVQVVVRPDDRPALVRADPSQVEQVFLNLAAHARDSMPAGGRLTIGVGRAELAPRAPEEAAEAAEAAEAGDAEAVTGDDPGPWVVLTVQDDGEGLDEEAQSHLFEPFFPARGKPLGLGLSAVYGIVRQNGGHIVACSARGEGTLFRIHWPRCEDAAAGAGSAETGGFASQAADHPMVLVAEDEESTRALVRDILEREGFDVITVSSGHEALEAVRGSARPPDLLLTDVVMPGMGGIELAGRIHPASPGTRVLFMSGFADHHLVRQGVIAPGKAFIRKPFAPGDLVAKVQEILAVRQAA